MANESRARIERDGSRQEEQRYEIFGRRKRRLLDLSERLRAALGELEMGRRAETVEGIEARLRRDTFKVMVLGEFKRGKSTLINALLGENVLPARVIPCTAVINEINWGERPQAILHFRHPLPERWRELAEREFPEDVERHLEIHAGKLLPPLPVAVEDLDRYVTIQDFGGDPKRSVAETPYAKLELSWPLELLENGVQLIDSPGLNEDEVRARITAEYLHQVDAVLFVLSAQALAGQAELTVIDEQVRGMGHESIFFLVNRFDQVPAAEQESLRRYAMARLAQRSSRGEEGIFFLSAFEALNARIEGDDERFAASGFPRLEDELARFLTLDRGPVKLLQPARQLDRVIQDVRVHEIVAYRKLIEESLDEVEARYAKARPLLDEAQARMAKVLAQIDNCVQDLGNEVRHEGRLFLRRVAEELPRWAAEVETKDLKIFTIKHQKQIEELAAEVGAALRERLDDELQAWTTEKLMPIIARHLQTLEAVIADGVTTFRCSTSEARTVILGAVDQPPEIEEDTTLGKRVLAGAVGLLGYPWTAAHGLRFGFQGLGTSFAAQIAAGLTVAVLGASVPIILAVTAIAGLVIGNLTAEKLTAELRKRVGRSLRDKLLQDHLEVVHRIGDKVKDQLGTARAEVEKQLAGELANARNALETVLRDKRIGEEQVRQRRELLSRVETELAEIDQSIRQITYLILGVPAEEVGVLKEHTGDISEPLSLPA